MNNDLLSNVLGPQYSFSPEGGTKAAIKWEDEKLEANKQEYTHLHQVDYLTGKDNKPLSYAQIETIEQGFQWLKLRHPIYPDEVLMCMAKAEFGLKNVKPAEPPSNKKKKNPVRVFSIERKPCEVRFDMLPNKSEDTPTTIDNIIEQ